MEPEQQRGMGELQQRNEHKRGGTQKQGIPRPEMKKKQWEKQKLEQKKNPSQTMQKIKEAKVIIKKRKQHTKKLLKKTSQRRKKALTEYIEAQKNIRTAIEEHENKKTKEKIEQITNMTKINPNTIWNTRKRTRTDN